jgi:putative transposase
MRDTVVDAINHLHEHTELPQRRLLSWLELCVRKFSRWRQRYGKVNEHNAQVPRDHQIKPQERKAIIDYANAHPLEGYRALTYMMMDADVAAVSPATTYRVLKSAGIIDPFKGKPSKKGTGFVQPLAPHEHWHTDFSYIKMGNSFYFLCAVLDDCSRSILAWDIRPGMTETDVQIVLQQARETYPQVKPNVITDQGS